MKVKVERCTQGFRLTWSYDGRCCREIMPYRSPDDTWWDRKYSAEALRLCAEAAKKCSFGKTANVAWLPATLYGNPVAVAILDGGEVVQALVGMESYTALDEFDIKHLSIFDLNIFEIRASLKQI